MLKSIQVNTPCCCALITIPNTYQNKTIICPNCNEKFVAKEILLLLPPTEQLLLPAPVLPSCSCQMPVACLVQVCPSVCPVAIKKAAEEDAAGATAVIIFVALVIVIIVAIVAG